MARVPTFAESWLTGNPEGLITPRIAFDLVTTARIYFQGFASVPDWTETEVRTLAAKVQGILQELGREKCFAAGMPHLASSFFTGHRGNHLVSDVKERLRRDLPKNSEDSLETRATMCIYAAHLLDLAATGDWDGAFAVHRLMEDAQTKLGYFEEVLPDLQRSQQFRAKGKSIDPVSRAIQQILVENPHANNAEVYDKLRSAEHNEAIIVETDHLIELRRETSIPSTLFLTVNGKERTIKRETFENRISQARRRIKQK